MQQNALQMLRFRNIKRKKERVVYMDQDLNLLSGIEFENLCQQLLEKMGFETETTKISADGGIDLIAYNYQPLVSGKYIIQCKRYSGSVGEPIIRDLYGVVTAERANKGILITTGNFTNNAISFSKDKNIELVDGNKLNILLKQNDVNLDNYYTSPEYILHDELERSGLSLDEYQFYFGDEKKASDLIMCKEELIKDEKNIKIRSKIIMMLFDRLSSIIFNEGNYNFPQLAIQGSNCITNYTSQIIKMNPKDSTEKNIRFYTMYIMCFCDIVKGNFSDAILRYDQLLCADDLDEYIDCFLINNCKIDILTTICTLLKFVGAETLITQYRIKHRNIIDEKVDHNNNLTKWSDDENYKESKIKESMELLLRDFKNENMIIIPITAEIYGDFKSIDDKIEYNFCDFTYEDMCKYKICIFDPYVDTDNRLVGTEFDISIEKLQYERKRIEALLFS